MALFGLFKNKKQEEPAVKVDIQPTSFKKDDVLCEVFDETDHEIDETFDDDDDYEEDVDDDADPTEAEALFQEAMDLYREGGRNDDYETAFERMRDAALKGHVKAMFYVGLMYKFGTGTNEDGPNESAAADWFSTAALRGHRESQYLLATYYMNESGGLTDSYEYQHAMKWYARAAEQGHPDAKVALRKYQKK